MTKDILIDPDFGKLGISILAGHDYLYSVKNGRVFAVRIFLLLRKRI
jgi:hypothetical protein